MAPGKGNTRMQQLRAARAVRIANIKKKREESEEGAWFEGQSPEETFSEDSEEEEFELTDNEEQERVPESIFDGNSKSSESTM